MKKMSVALAGATLLVAAGAFAAGTQAKGTDQTKAPQDSATPQPSADELKKHVTEIELYTRGALNDSKAVYQSAELPQGPMDRTLWKENATNITRQIGKAQDHIAHVRKMQAQAMSATGEERVKRFDEVTGHLRQARQAGAKLQAEVSRGQRMAIRDDASAVYAHLSAATDAIKEVEDAFGASSLDRITPPEKSPVRGVEGSEPSMDKGAKGQPGMMGVPGETGTTVTPGQPGMTNTPAAKPSPITNKPTPARQPMQNAPEEKSGSDWNKPAQPSPGY